MKVLVFALQKGGVSKSSSTLAIGSELAAMGQRVLLADLDPQESNLTAALGYDHTHIERSMYEVLDHPEDTINTAIVSTAHGFDLLPATLSLAAAEVLLLNRIGRELALRTALDQIMNKYDYILIDTPPSLGVLTINGLCAAHAVLVPLQAHPLALKALPQLEDTIRRVRMLNPTLHLGGIAITMHDRRIGICHDVEQEARRVYGDLVFQTVIPASARMVEAPAAQLPIAVYAPDTAPARAYRALAQEIYNRYAP